MNKRYVAVVRGYTDIAGRIDYALKEQLDRIAEDWASLLARAEEECAAGIVSQAGGSAVAKPTACRDGLSRLIGLRNAELRRVEQQRRRSRIP